MEAIPGQWKATHVVESEALWKQPEQRLMLVPDATGNGPAFTAEEWQEAQKSPAPLRYPTMFARRDGEWTTSRRRVNELGIQVRAL